MKLSCSFHQQLMDPAFREIQSSVVCIRGGESSVSNYSVFLFCCYFFMKVECTYSALVSLQSCLPDMINKLNTPRINMHTLLTCIVSKAIVLPLKYNHSGPAESLSQEFSVEAFMTCWTVGQCQISISSSMCQFPI